MTVSTVVPALIPATRPFDTVATLKFDDCQVASAVTFSDDVEFANTAKAEYCDVAPIAGGEPSIDSVEIVGQTLAPYAMPYENGLEVSIGRGLKAPIRAVWPQLKLQRPCPV